MKDYIEVSIKSVYGRDLAYPVCTLAKGMAGLAGSKTLTDDNIARIKSMGFIVRVVSPRTAL